ncbi:4-hydroxythreonine-4-phosphate dehydrogenase PdxA [Clostridium autoethanogenum]|uniref:Putative D-threonate 4-phosphate dehydrogenase n=1 Tax=Clostridium autoethanogenum TaxID=84023 RepID=A0A3M0SJY2_9CLOT|nr:4-hydroxythreonine-4-phosphate dehydrogenase PdxA [Clostridium autoethanogenum]RMC98826.1 4-hydroxythreonine-4-phosphate dehydrogenase PdxA [Clostridium autoethanogenum]
MNKKIVAIPIGDIAGVGPEIVVKALNKKIIYDKVNPLVVGELRAIKRALEVTNINLEINVVDKVEKGKFEFGTIDLIDLNNVNGYEIKFGEVQAKAGKSAFEFIKKSVELAGEHKVDAIATTPINKEALKAAKINYIGHTEILAGLTGTDDPMTMFQVCNLRVFFLTRHLSLKDAVSSVKKNKVYEYILKCSKGLMQLGVKNPRIAIAGLNPHAGEHGLFGMEEVEEIVPAVEAARKKGIDIEGPIGADSVFYKALKGTYDAVISLYHDQGHIATKMVDFEKTISITVGLPFIRTSVDHGTAFDIAGKNIVSSVSMEEAIKLAYEYAEVYK